MIIDINIVYNHGYQISVLAIYATQPSIFGVGEVHFFLLPKKWCSIQTNCTWLGLVALDRNHYVRKFAMAA